MFIETYCDERAPVPSSTSEPVIPYPELLDEELTVWRNYLPTRREIKNLYSPFITVPDVVIAEIKKATRSFDRIEIWSRAQDPMAVGVVGKEKPRYFSIVRWGDAELTMAQAKRTLWIEKCLAWLMSPAGFLGFLIITIAAIA